MDYCNVHAYFFPKSISSTCNMHVNYDRSALGQRMVRIQFKYFDSQNIIFTCIHLCMGLCAYVYEIQNKHTFLLILQYVQYKQP